MTAQNVPPGHSKEWEEMWALFAQEGKEMLDMVEESLLKLESNPTAVEQVANLFRALHNFKGMAHMMDLSVIESLAHHAEDVVALARDEGVILTVRMIDLLLEVLDHLRGMLDHALTHYVDAAAAPAEKLEAQLQAVLSEPPTQPASIPADVPASTAEMPEPSVTLIDPATDPTYVRVFLEMAGEALSRLHLALDALDGGDEAAVKEIEGVVDKLKHAAGRMGYERLDVVLDDLAAAAADPDGEARLSKLKRLELTLFEELTVIQESAHWPDSDDGMTLDIAWLFRHWHAERVFADLTCLGEIMDGLEQAIKQFLLDGNPPERNQLLADEAAYLLRAIYHSCIFYKLDQVAYLTLALEDLYARVAQAEMRTNEALLNLTRNYVMRLGSAIETVREGGIPELAALEAMNSQTEEILYQHTEGRVSQVTRDVLDLLDLPPEFKEMMTTETVIGISLALQAGERFYTILADLNRDEALAQAFFEWSQSQAVRLITNVTVYQNNHSLFNFLIATSELHPAIVETLAAIDPQGSLLLKECALREEVDPRQVMDNLGTQEISPRPERAADVQVSASSDILAGLLETIGELVATHATLQRVTERLTDIDLLESVERLARQVNGSQEHVHHKVPASLAAWVEDLRTLEQVETEIGVALEQLQEMTLALRIKSAAEIMGPLQNLVQDAARHQEKVVELRVEGADIELDHSLLNILARPVRRLVWFAVAHSLETPAQRRHVGKPVTGQLSVAVNKGEDCVQIVITDDGGGLDGEGILRRARELGWTSSDNVPPDQLSQWALKDGFGMVGGHNDLEGVDLAAIDALLRSHQGWLNVSDQPGQGTRFTLELPLDMAVIDGMIVRVDGVCYVAPIRAVRRIVKPEKGQITHTSADDGQDMLRLEDELIPIWTLRAETSAKATFQESLMLVVEKNDWAVALPVDEVIGQQPVLIRPLQGYLTDIQSVSGYALLGDGEVGMVLNLNRINVWAGRAD